MHFQLFVSETWDATSTDGCTNGVTDDNVYDEAKIVTKVDVGRYVNRMKKIYKNWW